MKEFFQELHAREIQALTEDTVLHIPNVAWDFHYASPWPGWENEYRPGYRFLLDLNVDLDAFCKSAPVPNQSECVLYKVFDAPRDGIALLGIGCDWWFEAYCNGEFCYSTFAQGNEYSSFQMENHPFFLPVRKGRNLLALHLRRGNDSWTFVCGDVPFERPVVPELTGGPWLSFPDEGKMSVFFRCSRPLGGGVEYRKAGTAEWMVAWHQRQGQILRRTMHSVHLTDLEPGAMYEYRPIAIHPGLFTRIPLGDVCHFQVPDGRQAGCSFFFTADLQFQFDQQQGYLENMLKAARAEECDFLVMGGDINSSFQPEEVISRPFTQLHKYGTDRHPLLYLRGNHELRGEHGDEFLDYFANPEGTTYGVFRFGDTAFLMLDAWEDKPSDTPGHPYCKWNLDQWFYRQEAAWLEKALEQPAWLSAKHHFVFCHGAPYSHYDGCHTMLFKLQEMTDAYFGGVLPRFRLDGWFAGHVHEHLRSIPGTAELAATAMPRRPMTDGLNYRYPVFTVGGPHSPERYPAKPKVSCFRVDVDADGFFFRSWDQDGALLEHLRYDNGGNCREITALPHYCVPAENKV